MPSFTHMCCSAWLRYGCFSVTCDASRAEHVSRTTRILLSNFVLSGKWNELVFACLVRLWCSKTHNSWLVTTASLQCRAQLNYEPSAEQNVQRLNLRSVANSAGSLVREQQLVTDFTNGNNKHLDARVEKVTGGHTEFTCRAFCISSLLVSRGERGPLPDSAA